MTGDIFDHGQSVTISLDGLSVPIRDLVNEVRREHRMRRQVYPKLVSKGRMTENLAQARLEMMLLIEGLLIRIDETKRE